MTQSLTNDEKHIRESILEKLRTDITTVKFTKADGSQREMRCTLVESYVPAEKRPKNTGTEAQDSSAVGSAVRVFDTDKQEWRSFRWDKVISVNGVLV